MTGSLELTVGFLKLKGCSIAAAMGFPSENGANDSEGGFLEKVSFVVLVEIATKITVVSVTTILRAITVKSFTLFVPCNL